MEQTLKIKSMRFETLHCFICPELKCRLNVSYVSMFLYNKINIGKENLL